MGPPVFLLLHPPPLTENQPRCDGNAATGPDFSHLACCSIGYRLSRLGTRLRSSSPRFGHPRTLYISYDISAQVLGMAIQLLKRAGDHDVKVAGVEVEVALTSIASLMSIGLKFVRPDRPQLLVLWRNVLPKPTSKDSVNSAGRSISDVPSAPP
jgi:hypothetical protein